MESYTVKLTMDDTPSTSVKSASILTGLICSIAVSAFFFPFGFNQFMPNSFNTKIGMALMSAPLLVYTCLKTRSIQVDTALIPSVFLAILFSLACFISVDFNGTADYSYASYIFSFGTWLGAGYTTYRILKYFYVVVDFELLTRYLVIVCVGQCILALAIDNLSWLKMLVDAYISQSAVAPTTFLNEVDRLYGIGASLDPAGTRFSIVLLAISTVLAKQIAAGTQHRSVYLYWGAFIVITTIGNMISRTTLIGALLGLGMLCFKSGVFRARINTGTLRISVGLLLLLVACLLPSIYFYQHDAEMRQLLRYGFEGFFNWVEKGEWSTSSTDLLLNAWIWPDDRMGWIIGYGLFDNWAFGTDIGYCRFIMYSGWIGMLLFAIFFIYNASACSRKFPSHRLFFLMLVLLSFLIWIKVSTDLYLIYALFFCIDAENKQT